MLEVQKGLTAEGWCDVLREGLPELSVKLTEGLPQAEQLGGLTCWFLEWRERTEQLMVFHLPVVEGPLDLECAVAGLVAVVDEVVCADVQTSFVTGAEYSAVAADREVLVSIRVQLVVPPSHQHTLALAAAAAALVPDVVPRALRPVTSQYRS